MAISREDVLHVAKLARLQLSPEEVAPLQRDLDQIICYVGELTALDTTGVLPTSQVVVPVAPFREDEQRPGLASELALAEAPRSAESGFAVPAFVEET